MKEAAKIWVEDAEYDLASAEVMYNSGRHFFVIFMCNLAVEKMLKAVWAYGKDEYPPKVHDLIYLMRKTEMVLPQDLDELIIYLSDKNVITRYPDGRREIANQLTKEKSKQVLDLTGGFIKWLKPKLK